jgi:hypothetical protein
VITALAWSLAAQQPAGAQGGGGRGAGGVGRGGAAAGGAGRGQAAPLPLFFKEAWKESPGNIPLTQDAVTNPDLVLTQYGPGNKDDFGITSEGNMNHVWTGLCNSACAVTLKHKANFVDLTGKARMKWAVKTSGFHEVRPVVKLADGTYLIGDHTDSSTLDYRESEFYFAELPSRLRSLNASWKPNW